jgi:hypothetical protein
MMRKIQWTVFALSLAFVLTIADDRAQSQTQNAPVTMLRMNTYKKVGGAAFGSATPPLGSRHKMV